MRRGIDNYKIDRSIEAGDDALESSQFCGFVLFQPAAFGARDVAMHGYFECYSSVLRPDASIFDVPRKALLIAVEIDRANPLPLL